MCVFLVLLHMKRAKVISRIHLQTFSAFRRDFGVSPRHHFSSHRDKFRVLSSGSSPRGSRYHVSWISSWLWLYVPRYVSVTSHIRSQLNDLGVNVKLTRIYSIDRITNSILLYTFQNNSLATCVTLILCTTAQNSKIIVLVPPQLSR